MCIRDRGTFLAEQIESYGCGISIDSSTEEAIRNSLSQLTIEQLNNISRREYEIEREEVFDSMDNLSTLLEEICKKRKN